MKQKLLFTLILSVAFSLSGFILPATHTKVSAQACTCWPPGATSDQGCMAYGCPTGTRRVCNCNAGGSGGACTPVAGCGSTCGGSWSCYCQPDASCGGGGGGTACTPNAQRCNGCDRVQCLSDGSGEIIIGPGSCCTPPPPACTSTAPAATTLVSPSNNVTIPSNSTTLNWNSNSAWGTGCPSNNNQYRVFLSQNCTGTYTNIANVASSVTNYNLSGLTYGSSYCWYVQTSNGSQTANSAVWRFTVNNNPSITSSTFGADSCGYSTTGRFDSISPNKVNPLTFNVGFSDPEADLLSGIFIGFVPQSALNANTVTYDQVYSAATNNNSIVTLLGYSTAGVLQNNWSYNMQSGGVEVQNTPGTATLLGAGTTSKVTYISPGNWNSSVTIRFGNTYPSGLQNVYVMATVLNPDGTYSTPNQGSSSLLMMTKVATWSFDMTNPTGSIVLSNYVGSNFTAAWSGSDASGLKNAYSYIIAGSSGSTLTDTTGGYAINPLGTADMNYPTPSNAGIGIANLPTTRNYTFTGVSDYTLKLALEDRACNVYTATAGAVIPTSWIYSREGIVSANGGILNIKIPTTVGSMNITDLITPNPPTGNSSSPYTTANNFVAESPLKLGTGSVISGTGTLPTPVATISAKDRYTYNYSNQATTPDTRSNTTNWYSYVLDLLNSNNASNILAEGTSGSIYISGSVSTYLNAVLQFYRGPSALSDTTSIYTIHIPSGQMIFNTLNCDRRVVFISPNPMTLVPNITRSGTGGCIFVSGGNVTVSAGGNLTTTPLATGGNSSYDVINGYIISNGSFISTKDNAQSGPSDTPATRQWDGMLIKGGVLATNVSLNRSLNSSGNADQPAEIYQYDPFYSLTFKDALASRFYTIREYIP